MEFDFKSGRLPCSVLIGMASISILLGCRESPVAVEQSRAARIRFQVESALNESDRGASVSQVVRRISIDLKRENNGLGPHLDTIKRLHDGLVALQKAKGSERTKKIHELQELSATLPTMEP